MNTTVSTFLLLLSLVATTAVAQGSGKVTLKAEIATVNDKSDMQVSVIDLKTKEVIQRDLVSNRFLASLTANGRYMLYFRKTGHPSARMIVDTHIPAEKSYYVHVFVNLKDLEPDMETGISMSFGTLKFDEGSDNFSIEPSPTSKAGMIAITARGLDSEMARF